MTNKTRRLLVVCFVAVALTLPVETILLRALSVTSQDQAAHNWVSSLTADQVATVSNQIQSIPFAYRREVMRALPPARRAQVWRTHIQRYISQHPGLDAATTSLLQSAASLATPQTFSAPSDDVKKQLVVIAGQVKTLLGADEADYLFYRLGGKDVQLSSVLPLGQTLANFVRSNFVVQAETEDCDCSTQFGCDMPSHCGGNVTCDKSDGSWPECGWFWTQQCDGLCLAGID